MFNPPVAIRALLSMVCVATVLCAVTTHAQAQRPERPYRGLFGGGRGATGQELSVNVRFDTGYDDDAFAQQVGSEPGGATAFGSDPRDAKSGTYSQLSGGLNYSLDRTRVSFGASFGGTTRHYPDPIGGFIAAYSGLMGAVFKLSEQSIITARQSIGFQPYIVLRLFPTISDLPIGQQNLPGFDFDTAREEHMLYGTDVQYSRPLGRNGSVDVGYTRNVSDFAADTGDLVTHGANARYSRAIGKGLGARVGYGYFVSDQQITEEVRRTSLHNLDVGLDLNRVLSLTRRTTFSFSTGSSATVAAGETRFHVTGNATLRHDIGRTWNASAMYVRSVGFVETFEDPVLSDALGFHFGGLISRRLEFQSSLLASLGAVGFAAGEGNDFSSYSSSAGLKYAISRYLAIGGDYFYYHYRFGEAVTIRSEMPHSLNRQGVRMYVALWAPLIHRARRPDAPR